MAVIVLSMTMVLAHPAPAQDSDRPAWAGFNTETLQTSGPKIAGTGRIGGIAVDRFGYIYVANQDNGVWRISPTGVSEKFADGFYGSSGILVLPDGSLLVGECLGHRISHVSRAGAVTPYATEGLRCPVGMTRTPDGKVFAINYMAGNIVEIAGDGSVSEYVAHELLAEGNGLTSDREGNLYAVSLGNGSVVRITPDGTVSELVKLPGGVNGHIAYSGGLLFVTKLWEHLVVGIEPDGTYFPVSGDGTQGWRDGRGQAAQQSFPNGIWAFSDWIYVNNLQGGMVLGEDGTIIVRRITIPTDRHVLTGAFETGGVTEMRAAYEWLKANRGLTGERAIEGGRRMATRLLRMGHVEAGLTLLEWVAADFHTADAFIHLGNALSTYGERGAAIASYRRALELDAGNAEATARLAGVEAFRLP